MKIKTMLLFLSLFLATTVSYSAQFNLPPQDADGWSILTPASDSRIIYVSSTDGDDATAQIYEPSSPEVGGNPTNPIGTIRPYQSIDAAMNMRRMGEPDWVLLKRGDVWVRDGSVVIPLRSGRSIEHRSVVASYGTAPERPLIKLGADPGFRIWRGIQYAALMDLHLYAHTRDPSNQEEYVSSEGRPGLSGMGDENSPNLSILIEGCVFEFAGVALQRNHVDIVFRRNHVLSNYSEVSHAQGMYTEGVSILLEENLFDHNGWLIQQSETGNNKRSEGQATIYNHNTYFTNSRETIFRNNMFLRASSIHNKFTSNTAKEIGVDEVQSWDILVDNNLYVEGEIGIGIGGNTDYGTGHRWRDIRVTNNVLSGIGRTRPTNRSIAWGIEASDWDNGVISGNHLIHYGDNALRGVWAISARGELRDVSIHGNTIHGLLPAGAAARSFVIMHNQTITNLRVFNNDIQLTGSNMVLIDTDYVAPGVFENNTYDTGRSTVSWFTAEKESMSFDGWIAKTGDKGSVAKQLNYVDPNRTVESYNAYIGGEADLEAFISEAKKQSKFNWRPEYTAAAVNDYIRAGFKQVSEPSAIRGALSVVSPDGVVIYEGDEVIIRKR